jgi:hypothetical protein
MALTEADKEIEKKWGVDPDTLYRSIGHFVFNFSRFEDVVRGRRVSGRWTQRLFQWHTPFINRSAHQGVGVSDALRSHRYDTLGHPRLHRGCRTRVVDPSYGNVERRPHRGQQFGAEAGGRYYRHLFSFIVKSAD